MGCRYTGARILQSVGLQARQAQDEDERLHVLRRGRIEESGDVPVMGARTGRMSQTNPDLLTIPGRPDLVRKAFVPQEGQKLYVDAKEAFANYFCKFDYTGQVPKEKEKNG